MMVANDRYVHELQKNGITPSHQRVMILKYLVENQCHPSVDQIFNALRDSIPTLSKATVYNTLNLFIEARLVRILDRPGQKSSCQYDDRFGFRHDVLRVVIFRGLRKAAHGRNADQVDF